MRSPFGFSGQGPLSNLCDFNFNRLVPLCVSSNTKSAIFKVRTAHGSVWPMPAAAAGWSSLSCCMPLFGEPVQQHFAPAHHGSVGTHCVVVDVFVRQCAEHIFVDLIENMADL